MIRAFNAGFRVYNVWISFSNDLPEVNENVLARSNEDAENEALSRLDSRVRDFVLTYGSDLQE